MKLRKKFSSNFREKFNTELNLQHMKAWATKSFPTFALRFRLGATYKAQQAQCFKNMLKVPFVLGRRFKSSDIACWATWERFFAPRPP